MEGSGGASALAMELDRIVERVRPWSLERWSARATGRDGTRADAAYALVLLLAHAYPRTPAGVVPARLRDLALADQLAVVGRELIQWIETTAPEDAPVLTGSLAAAVRSTRDALESAPLA